MRAYRLALMIAVTTSVAACDFLQGLNLPILLDHTVSTRVDVGVVTGTAAGELAARDVSYALEVDVIPVDLASRSADLKAHRGNLKSLELTGFRVQPASNSLTEATPPLDLFIGPAGTTRTGGAIHLATVPPIQPGSYETVDAVINAQGQAEAQAHLLSLDFVIIPTAVIDVEAGQLVPDGVAELDLTLVVKAVVSPAR